MPSCKWNIGLYRNLGRSRKESIVYVTSYYFDEMCEIGFLVPLNFGYMLAVLHLSLFVTIFFFFFTF